MKLPIALPLMAIAGPRYYWARIRVEEGRMTLWMPRLEAFRKAVEEGTLPCRTHKSLSV